MHATAEFAPSVSICITVGTWACDVTSANVPPRALLHNMLAFAHSLIYSGFGIPKKFYKYFQPLSHCPYVTGLFQRKNRETALCSTRICRIMSVVIESGNTSYPSVSALSTCMACACSLDVVSLCIEHQKWNVWKELIVAY